MQDLKVTLVQANLIWEDKEKNLTHLSELLQSIENTDLIILPEMFSTGFSMHAQLLAEQMDGESILWMENAAMEKQCVITGSLIIKDENKYCNRLIWMQPDGNYKIYDKRHLFTLAQEQNTYSAGKEILITELNGWKICPLVCYDLRFPVWSRNTADYDLLIYVANWPDVRIYTWNHLLIARAIENQCYVAGVNRVGTDGNNFYHSGHSTVIDPMGERLFETAHDEGVQTITLSKARLNEIRTRLPFLLDRDEFEIR
jgi:predicted amidohydrolase